MTTEILEDAGSRMMNAVQALDRDLATVRTGRANPALVDGLLVAYEGATYPLNQLAQISVQDARLLVIQPWDPNSIPDVEKAIQASDLGITPNNDGKVIRLAIPPLTEERRRELVRVVRKRVEDAKVAARNVRRDAQERIRKIERDSEISQDQARRSQQELQDHTDRTVSEIDEASRRKEEEVMAV